MTFTIALAGVFAEIHSIYDEVYELCRDYMAESQHDPDLIIKITEADISFEREKSIREALIERLPVIEYESSYLETLAVYRRIAEAMPEHDTFLLHGSALGVKNGDEKWAVLFTAPSGVGKTTHTSLWLENIHDCFVVNGDKPLIRADGMIEACGTPWAGKEGWNRNVMVPLRAICLLERGEQNSMEEVSFSNVFPQLIAQTYRPSDAIAMKKTMELLRKTGEAVRLYRLKCNMDPDAAFVAYNSICADLHGSTDAADTGINK